MLRFIGFLVLLIAVVSPALGDAASGEEALNGTAGLRAYVTKKGGKIRLSRDVMTGNGMKNTGDLEISIDQIEEVNSNRESLKPPVKLSAFSNVDFTVSRPRDYSIPNAPGVTADCLNCTGTLQNTVISLVVCAIKTNGTLTMNQEASSVYAGQLKFTFTMSSWGTWVNDSNKLAVDINIKTPANRNIVNGSDTSRKPTKFSLGADAFMEFSRMVYEDSQWHTMPDGYPMYTMKGVNHIIQLVFDHFNNTAVYDPSVEVGYQVDNSASTDTNATTTAATITDHNGASATVAVSSLSLLAVALIQILA